MGDLISPTVELLDLVWCNTNAAQGHSWQRLNSSMFQALRLVIEAGFAVTEDDLEHIQQHFRFGRWCHEGGFDRFYSYALGAGNLKAAKAIEKHLGRPAFIVDGPRIPGAQGGSHGKQRYRVCVGAWFEWQGSQVKVTSIEKNYFVACRYSEDEDGRISRTVLARHKITRKDILAERKKK